ncbi:MAG: hypothetical protein ABI823_13205 [Bryobacteraceae bacterium]
MKWLCVCIVLFSLSSAVAQTPTVAEQELARLKELAALGAIAPVKVREAESVVADARDEATLSRTLYAKLTPEELNEQQSKDMLAAARSLIGRQQERVDHERQLIAAGVTGKSALDAAEQDLANRKKTLELAEGRAKLIDEIAQMARAEAAAEVAGAADRAAEFQSAAFANVAEKYEGNGAMLTPKDIRELTLSFEKEFSRPLPVSARGETAVHRALGFDHRGRLDIAVEPDTTEGKWLRQHLTEKNIPFYAFRAAIAGKATAPHIHVGPGSVRIRFAD